MSHCNTYDARIFRFIQKKFVGSYFGENLRRYFLGSARASRRVTCDERRDFLTVPGVILPNLGRATQYSANNKRPD